MVLQQQVHTFQDILDVMDGNPEIQRELYKHMTNVMRSDEDFRNDLRKEILTEELMRVPVRLTVLEEKVDKMAEDLAEVKTTVSRWSGTIARLAGEDYERLAVEPARRAIRERLGAMYAVTIHGEPRSARLPIHETLLSPALLEGLISPHEGDELERADSIVRCEYADGHQAYGVIAISVTVHDDDRIRAHEHAKILAAATGVKVVPFVVGKSEDPAGPGVPEVAFIEYTGSGCKASFPDGEVVLTDFIDDAHVAESTGPQQSASIS